MIGRKKNDLELVMKTLRDEARKVKIEEKRNMSSTKKKTIQTIEIINE